MTGSSPAGRAAVGVGIMLTASVNLVQSAWPEEVQGDISGVSRWSGGWPRCSTGVTATGSSSHSCRCLDRVRTSRPQRLTGADGPDCRREEGACRALCDDTRPHPAHRRHHAARCAGAVCSRDRLHLTGVRSRPRYAPRIERGGQIVGRSGRHQGRRIMPSRRYEVRVAGRLSDRARNAFIGMDVNAVPAETVIADTVEDDDGLHRLLALIQSLGLHVLAVDQVAPRPRPPPLSRRRSHGTPAPGSPPG
jgi:hypothetical protein